MILGDRKRHESLFPLTPFFKRLFLSTFSFFTILLTFLRFNPFIKMYCTFYHYFISIIISICLTSIRDSRLEALSVFIDIYLYSALNNLCYFRCRLLPFKISLCFFFHNIKDVCINICLMTCRINQISHSINFIFC